MISNQLDNMNDVIPHERIENRIFVIRGVKVMIDRDLAELYGVKTMVLNQAVRRNSERFPEDFMFQLTKEEMGTLISQIVISKPGRGGVRKPSLVFTEQGVAMLSSVLRSKKAVTINIQIMRTFMKMRDMLMSESDLRRKIESLEKHYDEQFKIVFDALRRMYTDDSEKPEIGYQAKKHR